MKRLLVVGLVLGLSSGAFATDYYWDCTTAGSASPRWTLATSWDNGSGGSLDWPDDPSDRAIVQTGGSVNLRDEGLGAVITVGELIVSASSQIYANGSTNSLGYTMNILDDCGLSGDFWHTSTNAVDHYGRPSIWNVDGNYRYMPTSWGTYVLPEVNLYGTEKGYYSNQTSMYSDQVLTSPANRKYVYYLTLYGSYYDNAPNATSGRSYANASFDDVITVKDGGRILARKTIYGAPADSPTAWTMHELRLEGATPQDRLPALGDCVTFRFAASKFDNSVVRWAVTGGVTYPQDVIGTGIYWGATVSNPIYNLRIKEGDLTVGRDLMFENERGTASGGQFYFCPEDNAEVSPVARNVTVYRDFKVGTASASNSGERYGVKFQSGPNSSTIRVGRDLIFGANSSGYYGWAPQSRTLDDLGNATIYVGRHLRVYRMDAAAIAAWNAGTSTIICDGNGTGSGTQILHTFGYLDGVELHNLVIDSPKSVVLDNTIYNTGADAVMPGGLLLTGALTINTRFNDSNLPIAFNGPEHLLKLGPSASIAGGALDNIILLPDAVLRLGSDVTMDNLDMQTGSELYLNGFTLTAEGSTWISDQVSAAGVPYTAYGSDGLIYGTFAIPEPATLLLLGTGALGVLGWVRRRRMA